MKTIIIDCDECIMRATDACDDCLVTHMLDTRPGQSNSGPGKSGHGNPEDNNSADNGQCRAGHAEAIVFDLAEQRAVRWFAEAGLVPTLRHRAASSS